jgi:hypothetical protein
VDVRTLSVAEPVSVWFSEGMLQVTETVYDPRAVAGTSKVATCRGFPPPGIRVKLGLVVNSPGAVAVTTAFCDEQNGPRAVIVTSSVGWTGFGSRLTVTAANAVAAGIITAVVVSTAPARMRETRMG